MAPPELTRRFYGGEVAAASERPFGSALRGALGTGVPQRLELGLRNVAVEHRERQPREAEPAGARVRWNELVGDQAVVADAELALDPAVLVDLGVQRPSPQCRELARRPLQIEHSACPESRRRARERGRSVVVVSCTVSIAVRGD